VIGVISDTHGLMRPEALAALAGSELIIHAGDVDAPAVLEALQEIAPVITVTGRAIPAHGVCVIPWGSSLEMRLDRAADMSIYIWG